MNPSRKRAKAPSWKGAISRLRTTPGANRDLNEEIHELRVAIKTCRALLRLVQSEISLSTFCRSERVLKHAADELAVFRDSAVLNETLDWFLKKVPSGLCQKMLADLRPFIAELQQSIDLKKMRSAGTKNAHRVHSLLDNLLEVTFPNFGETAGCGIERTYRCTRKACRKAAKSKKAEDLHKLRRWAKYLLLQITTFYPSATELKGLVKDLDTLQKRLGRHHDLHVLWDQLEARLKSQTGREAERELDSLSRKIARKCLKKANRLFALKPAKFVREVNPE